MYKRINHYKFYQSGKTIEIMSSRVLHYFFTLIKIPKRKRNAEISFNVSYYYMYYYL